MANKYFPRGISFYRKEDDGGNVAFSPIYSCAASGRDGVIQPGRLLKFTGSLDSDGRQIVDVMTAADTANASGVICAGLCVGVRAANNNPLYVPTLSTTTAGLVQTLPATAGTIFGALEDAVGGVMTLSGSVQLVLGTVTNISPETAEELQPQPYATDMLDSSTRHATATQLALQIVGRHPSSGNRDAAAQGVILFKVNPTWLPA